MQSLPDTGFVRLAQIIGRREVTKEQADANRLAGKRRQRPCAAIPAVIPMSASAWWRGVKNGRFPSPVKCGHSALWRVEQIQALIDKLGQDGCP